jgi:hypothetical protein
MSLAPALVLRPGYRERPVVLGRLPSVPSGLAKRARIVLLAANRKPTAVIARIAGVSRPTVIGWQDQYELGGIKALDDEPRPGRPAEIDEIEVVVATPRVGARLSKGDLRDVSSSAEPRSAHHAAARSEYLYIAVLC